MRFSKHHCTYSASVMSAGSVSLGTTVPATHCGGGVSYSVPAKTSGSTPSSLATSGLAASCFGSIISCSLSGIATTPLVRQHPLGFGIHLAILVRVVRVLHELRRLHPCIMNGPLGCQFRIHLRLVCRRPLVRRVRLRLVDVGRGLHHLHLRRQFELGRLARLCHVRR